VKNFRSDVVEVASMLRWFVRGSIRGRGQARVTVGKRRVVGFRGRLETLEGRNLLSTVAAAINHAPTLADPGTKSVEEGDSLAVQANATDPDAGQTLTYSLDPGAPAGAAIDPTTGLFTWTPPPVQQITTVTIRATDSGSPRLSDAKTLTVMVFDVAPKVQAGVNATIDQGTALVRAGSFSDPNPDTWSATVDYGDGSGVQPLALAANKTFQLDHTYKAPGQYMVSVTINDAQAGQGRGFFAVQVRPTTTATPSGTDSTPAGSSAGQSAATATPSGGSAAQQSDRNPRLLFTPVRHARPRAHLPRFHRIRKPH
jgi:hypothetical protein